MVVTEEGAALVVVVVPVVVDVPWEVRRMSIDRLVPMLRAPARSSPVEALPWSGDDPILGGRPAGRES